MKKTLTALAVAATFAFATLATTQPAQAGKGGNVAAGIIGGLAAGALFGAAVANPYYGAGHYYGPPRRYYYRQHCWWERERYWTGYGWRSQRVRVCD